MVFIQELSSTMVNGFASLILCTWESRSEVVRALTTGVEDQGLKTQALHSIFNKKTLSLTTRQ